MSTPAKKIMLDKPNRIGTHSGTFHCDEVLACYMLLKLYPHTPVIRTRNEDELATCDIVVDVGGQYDPDKGRFDHHQKTFDLSMNSLNSGKEWSVRLSSAGLVYHHFGRALISLLIGKEASAEMVELVWDQLYESLMLCVDAIDNGVDCCEGPTKYEVTTDLASRVKDLNPWWNDPQVHDEQFTKTRFEEAMRIAGKQFEDKVNYYWRSWIPARELVKKAYESRFELDSSGKVMNLEQAGCPWKKHLFNLEDPQQPKVVYVLYKDKDSWRVQAVPENLRSFASRLALPEEWRGLREEELSKQVGEEGCIFVHASGFIGGHRSKQGALAMTSKALLKAESSRG